MFAVMELRCVKLCGKNNFQSFRYIVTACPIGSMGVRSMYNTAGDPRGVPSAKRCGAMLLAMFLTGVVLGCGLARLLGLQGIVPTEKQAFRPMLVRVLLWNAKFLFIAYLLAFSPGGMLLLPTLFGLEGAMLGALFCTVLSNQGMSVLPYLVLRMLFRLILVVPYGFLLGCWSMRQSLGFGSRQDRSAFGVGLATAVVLLASSLLECTVAQNAAYYLRFGV